MTFLNFYTIIVACVVQTAVTIKKKYHGFDNCFTEALCSPDEGSQFT